MVHVIADGFLYGSGVFYGVLLHYFNESKSTTSWVLSIMSGLSCIIGPVSSAFTNKFGCRVATITGTLLAFSGIILSVAAPNIIYLYFSMGLLTGIGLGMITIPNVVVVACYFEKKRALANGIALSGSGIGTFVMAPLYTLLIEVYEWQGAMLIISSLMLNCVIFALLFRPIVSSSAKRAKSATMLKFAAGNIKININHKMAQSFDYISSTNGKVDIISTTSSDYRSLANTEKGKSVPSLSADVPTVKRPYTSEPYRKHRSSTQSGLMYHDDILYASDLSTFPEGIGTPIGQRTEPSESVAYYKWCKCCSGVMADGFFKMFNFSMLKNPRFCLLGLCYFFFSIGLNIPYVYTVEKAIEDRMATPEQASLLLSVVGFFNTIARITSGFLVKFLCFSTLRICCTCFTICGIATISCAFAQEYYQAVLYCAIFGTTAGMTTTLISLILVELFGLENLTNAFGLLLMLIGVSIFIGAPINGVLYDVHSSHRLGFFFSGGLMTLSGLLLCLVPCIKTNETPTSSSI